VLFDDEHHEPRVDFHHDGHENFSLPAGHHDGVSFWLRVFYFSERGRFGLTSVSSRKPCRRKLFRKKPNKIVQIEQKRADGIWGNRNARSSGLCTSLFRDDSPAGE
jgi:hypothetical protein